MFGKIEIFNMAGRLMEHSAARQATIAGNIANSDTPSFRAKDLKPFHETYEGSVSATRMKTSRPGHIGAMHPRFEPVEVTNPHDMSPNGNSVSIEQEMVKAVEAGRKHDLALSIYSTSLNVLRTSLGRGG